MFFVTEENIINVKCEFTIRNEEISNLEEI